METLRGLDVVVTGGAGALGHAVVERLVSEGARCHVPSSHAGPEASSTFAGQSGVRLVGNVDLTDAGAVERFYAGVPTLWASIHLAGGFAMAQTIEADPDQFAKMIDVNARTAWLCCRSAARTMAAAGTPGRIVNVAARPGLDPRKGSGMVAYAMSKAAVAALTVALAEELKSKGVLVNAVAPATLDTPANRAAMPDADPSKWVSTEGAAAAIVHLASPLNAAISGALVPLYGRG